jgi:AAA family ATP:ADP antiporter
MLAIYHSLQSESPDQRENALDFLENLLEPNLKKVILPLVETELLSSITDTAIRGLERPIPDARESYDLILQLPDEELNEAVLEVLAHWDNK